MTRTTATWVRGQNEPPQQVVIKTYKGSEQDANGAFQRDVADMAAAGYFPTTQSWAPGAYGCGAFVLALLLCVILIGFIVFIYMLIVKPPGVLSVTYEYRPPTASPILAVPVAEKTCPQCAEQVKAAALVCRFCGYKFGPSSS